MKISIVIFFFVLVSCDIFSQIFQFTETLSDSRTNATIDFTSPDTAILNLLILQYTNKEREKRKIPPLAYSPELAKAAQYHTGQMVEQSFFSHKNPNDILLRSPSDRIAHFGHDLTNSTWGENIIKSLVFEGKISAEKKNGQYSFYRKGIFGKKPVKPSTYTQLAKRIVNQWMHSKGHRENILNPNFQFIGIGNAFPANPYLSGKPGHVLATQNFIGIMEETE